MIDEVSDNYIIGNDINIQRWQIRIFWHFIMNFRKENSHE